MRGVISLVGYIVYDCSGSTLTSALGQFGKVNLARYRGRKRVAVKVMKENTMEEESFIEEAEVMTYGCFNYCFLNEILYVLLSLLFLLVCKELLKRAVL